MNSSVIKETPLKPSSSRSHFHSAFSWFGQTDIFLHPFNPNASVYKDNPSCKIQVPFKTNPEDKKNSAQNEQGLIDKYKEQTAQTRVNVPDISYIAPPRPEIPLPITEYSTRNEMAAITKTNPSSICKVSMFSRQMIKRMSAQNMKMAADCWKNAKRYVGWPEKAKKIKISEKEAMGRAMVRVYKSKFFHLGSEKYQILDR